MTWFLMSTAPHDGTLVDLWCASQRRETDVRWDPNMQAWMDTEGRVVNDATHWMPRPGGLEAGAE